MVVRNSGGIAAEEEETIGRIEALSTGIDELIDEGVSAFSVSYRLLLY